MQTSPRSLTGSVDAFNSVWNDMQQLHQTLTRERHTLAREAYYLIMYAQEKCQSVDQAGMDELTQLLASYTTWASHRKFLAHC